MSFVSPELKSLSRSRPAGVILRPVATPSGLCNGYRSIGKNKTPCYVIEVRTIMSVLLITYAAYHRPGDGRAAYGSRAEAAPLTGAEARCGSPASVRMR